MPSIKDIKQRISNVSTTQQIIRAMDMVASTKLHKARARLYGIRPLYGEMQRRIEDLSRCEEAVTHAFAAPRKVKSTAYIVITSNKGLCGGYNTDVAQAALSHMEQGKNEKIVAVGAKGWEYFRRFQKNILYRITDIPEAQIYQTAGRLGELASSLYLSGEADEVYVVYAYFESTLSHLPQVERVLPLPIDRGGAAGGRRMKYEPDAHTFIDHFVPLYLHTCFFAASAEATACEYAARMLNMDSAGKNASEAIDKLKRMYNRKRQTAITQELSEIVGGANIQE